VSQLSYSRIKLKYLLGSLALITILIWIAVLSYPSQKLKIIFCDVGQGDAILIQKGTKQILIDGGPNKKVLDCLSNNLPFWDRTIEVIALTHPEADHLEGLNYVIERYNVGYFMSGLAAKTQASLLNLKSKNINHKVEVINPYLGDKYRMGDIELITLWPDKEWTGNILAADCSGYDCQLVSRASNDLILTEKNLNQFSLVFLLNYGNLKVLFTGDADASIQDEILLNNPGLESVDLLKVPHHGAGASLSQDFLDKIKPKMAIISVGRNNFGHPDKETIHRLEEIGAKVRRTDLEGEIKLEF